jgi:hypothetical protein
MLKWFKKKNPKQVSNKQVDIEQDDEEINVRKPIEVAERILSLLAVIGKVHQGNDSRFTDWFDKNSIEKYLSQEECIFINTDSPEQNVIRNFSWRAEALTSLLWSIGLISEMPPLNQEFDVYSLNGLKKIINDPEEFKRRTKLRPDNELNEMEGQLYHEHWRVRDAQFFGKEMPSELNPSIVYERRYGLSWLVGWGDDWDDVPTDT